MATKKKTSEKTTETPQVVLDGTYRKENADWIKEHKLYNLPLPSCGKVAFHENISQIVLLADGFQAMAFAAKFREVVDATWLKENGYKVAAADKAHGTSYALYELGEKVPFTAALSNSNADVFVASSRCPIVKIDAAFYAKPYPKTGGKSMPYIFELDAFREGAIQKRLGISMHEYRMQKGLKGFDLRIATAKTFDM